MSATHATPPIHLTIAGLLGQARDMLARLFTRGRSPRPTANQRLARTVEWLVALGRVLAGDRFYLLPARLPAYPRFPGRYPAFTNALRAECGLPPNPASTPAERAARHLRYMRQVFATQGTARIAARLARRLGLTARNPAWPADLLAIPEPPAAWAARATTHAAPSAPPPTARPWFPLGIPAAAHFAALRLADAAAPHRRE